MTNLNEEIYSRFPRLWGWLNLALLTQVKYDSADKEFDAHPSKDPLDVANLISVQNEKGFKFQYLQGTEEIEMEVVLFANDCEFRTFNL